MALLNVAGRATWGRVECVPSILVKAECRGSSGIASCSTRCGLEQVSAEGFRWNVGELWSSCPCVEAGLTAARVRKDGQHSRMKKEKHRHLVTSMAVTVAEPPVMSEVVKWQTSKRIQTQIVPIAKDITTIRSLDWDRDRFDIEFGLSDGTTYNSYVIEGDKVAIVDASHEKFKDLYLAAIQGLIDLGNVEYIVANHTEPDHSFLIPNLLELAPNATVVGSKTCIMFLQNQVLRPFKSLVVKGGQTLDLGRGHILEFVMAPNLHWPDTMFTLDRGSGVLFTCDAFGMHYCTEALFDEDLQQIEPHYRFYYDCLMRPNARSVLGALKKIADMDFGIIATGHGPLLRYNLAELLSKYQSWSEDATAKQLASFAVLYVSDYGYSDRLSQAIARGLTKTNCGAEMLDLNNADVQELVETVSKCGGVVVMVPPSSGVAIQSVRTLVATMKSGKQPLLIAESYGGDDEPVDTLLQRFMEIGVVSPLEPLRVKGEPTEATYQQYEEAGTDLGQFLTQKKSIRNKLSNMPPDVARAIGRISGGLYVVTAAKGASRGAMIASWVSQASFKPLGITIAVAKDRAIESLMQVGDSFVLNCLEEGNFGPLMKHFLKRFTAGASISGRTVLTILHLPKVSVQQLSAPPSNPPTHRFMHASRPTFTFPSRYSNFVLVYGGYHLRRCQVRAPRRLRQRSLSRRYSSGGNKSDRSREDEVKGNEKNGEIPVEGKVESDDGGKAQKLENNEVDVNKRSWFWGRWLGTRRLSEVVNKTEDLRAANDKGMTEGSGGLDERDSVEIGISKEAEETSRRQEAVRKQKVTARNWRRLMFWKDNDDDDDELAPEEKLILEDLDSLSFNWKELFDPTLENILALGLTALLAVAFFKLFMQLFGVVVTILVTAMKYTVLASILLGLLIFVL